MRHRTFIVALAWLIGVGVAFAAISAAEKKRLESAAEVVQAMRNQPDGIPSGLWDKAACAVVIPAVKKAALGIGGEYGKGVMTCRTDKGWGAPVFMELAKGSIGLQIGGEETDLVLLVMNRDGAEKMLKNKVTLGTDASVAAGPVGRTAAAGTDIQLRAEILSYSRARGAFAGIDLSGGKLGPDKDANEDAYGKEPDPVKIALSGAAPPPPEAAPLMKALAS